MRKFLVEEFMRILVWCLMGKGIIQLKKKRFLTQSNEYEEVLKCWNLKME